MLIGIGCTVPEIVNLPGQSGGEEAALDYSLASACNNNNAFSPSQATPSGGVFSATPSGLNINSSTGEVTPVGSTPQAYTIAYAVGGSTSTFDLTIKPLDNATFSYSASSFPKDASNPSPNFTSETITGGAFSATPSGLSINTSTGEINLSASTIGSYTITYNTASSGSSVCPSTSNVPLAVGAASLAQVNNVYSMEFDGAESRFQTDSITIGNTFTFSLWLNANSFAANVVFLASPNYFISGFNGNFIIRRKSNKFQFYSYNSNGAGTEENIEGTFSTSAAQWYHVVLTNDATTAVFYINGSPITTTGVNTKSLGDLTNGLIIGDGDFRVGTSNTGWNGKIDEVGVWNTALTAQEVQSIYLATETGKTADLSQLTTPPVKWYRMGD